MTGDTLYDVMCCTEAHEPRKRRIPEVVKSERLRVGECGDLIADRVPPDSTREVTRIERTALDPGEHVIEVVRC